MAKAVAGAALLAGAIALTVATGGVGAVALVAEEGGIAGMLFGAEIATMAVIGASLELGSIADALTDTVTTPQTVRAPAAPWQVIYGNVRCGGTQIDLNSYGDNFKYCDMIIVLACHPCVGVQQHTETIPGDATFPSFGGLYINGQGMQWRNNAMGGSGTPHSAGYDINGIPFGFTTSNNIQDLNQNHYSTGQHVYMETYNGTGKSWQAPDGGAASQVNNQVSQFYKTKGPANHWDDTCTMMIDPTGAKSPDGEPKGYTYVYLRLLYGSTLWSGGIPASIRFDVQGKSDIWDPRLNNGDGGYAYTNNAALVIADFMTNPYFGMGYTHEDFDTDALIAAANLCDVSMPLASGGSIAQYTINGTFTTNQNPATILKDMLTACDGDLCEVGGKWFIYPGAYVYPTATIDSSMMVGPIQVKTGQKGRDLVNAVKGTFICPAAVDTLGSPNIFLNEQPNIFNGQWQKQAFPPYAMDPQHGYASDVWLAADGQKLYKQLDLPFTTSAAACQRLAKQALLKNRIGNGLSDSVNKGLSFTVECSLKAYNIVRHDTVWVSYPRFNWTAPPAAFSVATADIPEYTYTEFEVTGTKFRLKEEDGKPPVPVYELTLRATSPDIYEWLGPDELTMTDNKYPQFANMMQVAPPTNLTLESSSATAAVNGDGVSQDAILAKWTPPADGFVLSGGQQIVQLMPVVTATETFSGTAGSADITIGGSSNPFASGESIFLAGAGPGGAPLTATIYSVDGQTCTLTTALSTTVTNAAILAAGWQTFATVSGDTKVCLITGVVDGDQYYVQVYAKNSAGKTSPAAVAGPITATNGNTTGALPITLLPPGTVQAIGPERTLISGLNLVGYAAADPNADQTALHADLLLQNPNFEADDSGWDLNGWEIVPSGTDPSAFIYSNLQNLDGNPGTWKQAVTAATSGGQVDAVANIEFGIASPSVTGSAIKVTASPSVSGKTANVLNYRHLGVSIPAAGGSSTNDTLTLTVSTPVTTDTTQASGDITIHAAATDSAHTVTNIQVYKDGASSSTYSSGGASLAYTDSGIMGPHTYAIKAWNSNGDSTIVTVNVGFGPDLSTVKTFTYRCSFYVPSATMPQLQALEFDPDFWTGSHRLFVSAQWHPGTGEWRLWDTANDAWVSAPSPAYTPGLTTETWHTLEITGHCDFSAGTYGYDGISLDGSELYGAIATVFHHLADATQTNCQAEMQVDLNTSATSAIMYYDDIELDLGTGASSGSGPTGLTGDLASYDFDSGSTSGLTATGSPAIDATSAYTTPNSVHFPAGQNFYATDAFAAAFTVYTRQYIKINTLGSVSASFLQLWNGTSAEMLSVYFNPSGSISLYNQGTGTSVAVTTTPLSTGEWHYIEVQWAASATAGVIVVKIDGSTVYTETGLNTGTTAATVVRFGHCGVATGWDTNQDNVDVSSTGWLGAVTLGSESSFPTSGVNGSPYYAYLPAGVIYRNIQNKQKINCGPGDVISVTCWMAGTGGSGHPNLYILFYDASGNRISVPAAAFTESSAYKQIRVAATAPAGTVYAVCFVENETATTGEWVCGAFAAAILPRSLSDVPDDDTYAKPKAPYIQNGVPNTYMGNWSSATAYVPGEEVGYNGNYWSCLAANTNSAPTQSNANWKLVGPASLSNVPDGGGRYAAIEETSDQTINHFQTIQATFPASDLNAPLNTQITMVSIAIDVSSTEDIVTVLATAPVGGVGAQTADVDGATAVGFGTRLGLFMGSVSGLSAGSHTINIRFTRDTGSSDPWYINASTGGVLVQQICSQAGGMNQAPTGGRTIVKAHVV